MRHEGQFPASGVGHSIYQDFIDLYPVTRFDRPNGSSVYTEEGGVHHFPDRTALSPAFFEKFDWVVRNKGHQDAEIEAKTSRRFPKYVYAEASENNVKVMLKYVDRWIKDPRYNDEHRPERVLVLGGSDLWISDTFVGIPENPYFLSGRMPTDDMPRVTAAVTTYTNMRSQPSRQHYGDTIVRLLKKYFGRIVYEHKDMAIEGVDAMPTGFTEWTLRGNGKDVLNGDAMAKLAMDAIANADINNKPNRILGAFNKLDDLDRCSQGWGEGRVVRDLARDWLKTPPAQTARVTTGVVELSKWWSTLASHKFAMAPPGCGVQTQKQIEALLVLTVPIVWRSYSVYSDLMARGFPMLAVGDWDELANQGGWLEEQWNGISPRLVSFRQNCLTTDGYWKLITGVVSRCQ